MQKVLGDEFFDRSTLLVAKELLGKYLVRKTGEIGTVAYLITETEAYDGFGDKASHASRGQTPRNTPMFGKAGTIYVYFTYGMHWMLNIVCGKETYPAAVLIRGAGGVDGPARLTKTLGIDRRLNTRRLSKNVGLWIEDRGTLVAQADIETTPRVGVAYAGAWAKKPWRFVLTKTAKLRLLSRPLRRRALQTP